MNLRIDRMVRVSCLALVACLNLITGLCVFAVFVPAAGASEAEITPEPERSWQTLGLMRIRDMTPFGISRLDMLPAHAVPAAAGTFAVEVNVSYQNTWALSENVQDYLTARGIERGAIRAEDIAAIQALPGDADPVDGEFGLVDLTLHYRTSSHFGLYATIPYFTAHGGFLDSTIEGFHDGIGFSSAGREFVPRNRWLAVADLERTSIVADQAPESEFGDPVFGLRYSLSPSGGRYNVVIEAAAKLVLFDSNALVSTGSNDYGAQISLQRFFTRNALYLSLAEVYYQSPNPGLAKDLWIPTLIAGWETRLTRNTNFIVQASASKSTVQETQLDELSADKFQATLGLQRFYRGNVLRFGITENIANFNNTPYIGVNLSVARILFAGSKSGRSQP